MYSLEMALLKTKEKERNKKKEEIIEGRNVSMGLSIIATLRVLSCVEGKRRQLFLFSLSTLKTTQFFLTFLYYIKTKKKPWFENDRNTHFFSHSKFCINYI